MKKNLLTFSITALLFIIIFSFIPNNVLGQSSIKYNEKQNPCEDCYGIWECIEITTVHMISENKWDVKTKPPEKRYKFICITKNGFKLSNGNTEDKIEFGDSYVNGKVEYRMETIIEYYILAKIGLIKYKNKNPYDHFNKYHDGYRLLMMDHDLINNTHSCEYPCARYFDCKSGVLIDFSFSNMRNSMEYRTYKKISGEIVQENSNTIINLYSQTPSTIYSSPGENNTCNLQADVDCSNSADKKGRAIKIEVMNGQKGTFNTTTASTDANGKAYFTYTAPDESALNGQKEIKVEIKATDVKSGEYSVIPITILNRNVKSGFSAQHIIMPQGKEFYNELTIFINAPPKGDGYQATLTTNDALGLITSSKTNPGGESPALIKIKPGQEYKFYYHNTGVMTQTQPIDEEVTLEIPELKFKQTVNISVGMDLMVQSVERKYKTGTIYPALPEPLEISITDNFHPNADLEKIFDDFDINMRVRIEPEKISQSSVMSKYQDEWMSRVLTKFEGFLFGKDIVTSSGDAIVSPKKSKDGKYLVCKTTRESLPFVIMFDRGTFDFKVELIDINFSEEHSNNSGTISFTVDAYRDKTDEILKTALIPMAKVILDKVTYGLVSYADVIASSTDAIVYNNAIKDGKLQDAVIGIFGIYCSKLDDSKVFYNCVTKEIIPLTERTKRVVKLSEVAINTLLIANIDASENPKNEGGGKNSSVKDISDRLKYAQLILKGMKNNYFVMMNKAGLKNYSATLKGGNKLLPSNDKVLKANSIEERIDNDNDFVIIPLENSEEIILSLDFNGSSGYFYRVTKDKIDKIEYPKSSSNVKVNITSTNALTFGKQEKEKTKEKEKKANLFSGSWETADFGTVSFIISGSDVVATCTKNLSGMKGTLSSDGTKITGSWAKFPTYSSPNDAGKFEVTVSGDGKSFTGKWGKGTDSNSKLTNNLNGKKK